MVDNTFRQTPLLWQAVAQTVAAMASSADGSITSNEMKTNTALYMPLAKTIVLDITDQLGSVLQSDEASLVGVLSTIVLADEHLTNPRLLLRKYGIEATQDQINNVVALTSNISPAFFPGITDGAGSQIVDVGGTKTGSSATGLANDGTVYAASIIVDGGISQPISILGSTAQTYTTLISQLQADTTGATWSLYDGNLRVVSNTIGLASTINLTDVNLFINLTIISTAGYQVIDVGGNKTDISLTNLINDDSTIYSILVTIDAREPQLIKVVGSTAQTYGQLITQLNADIDNATVFLTGGNLRVVSNTTGTTSTVVIAPGLIVDTILADTSTDVDPPYTVLSQSLTLTLNGFVNVQPSTPGTTNTVVRNDLITLGRIILSNSNLGLSPLAQVI